MSFVVTMYNQNIEKAKLCYMDADSFIEFLKSNDIYKDIAVMKMN